MGGSRRKGKVTLVPGCGGVGQRGARHHVWFVVGTPQYTINVDQNRTLAFTLTITSLIVGVRYRRLGEGRVKWVRESRTRQVLGLS